MYPFAILDNRIILQTSGRKEKSLSSFLLVEMMFLMLLGNANTKGLGEATFTQAQAVVTKVT